MPKKRRVKRKTKRSAAQKRATKKMQAAARRALRTGRAPRRRTKRNPAYGNYLTALPNVNPTNRKRKVTRRRNTEMYTIKGSGKWFDGKGWSKDKRNAARWIALEPARKCAVKLANHTNKSVTVHKG